MKKWLMLILVIVAMTTILTAATIKVAILPLKRIDSSSKYIQKFLTMRDLDYTFKSLKNTHYELLNMKETAAIFKEMEISDIDEMDKADLAELSKQLKTDVILRGTISAQSSQVFEISFVFYSARTDDIKSIKSFVVKDKKKRWATLEKDIFETLDKFVSEEAAKIATMALQDYQSEDFVNAEKKFSSILVYNPNDYSAYTYLGLIAYKQKNYDKAITQMSTAYDLLTKEKPDSTKDWITTHNSNLTSLLQNMVDVYSAAKNTDKMLEKQSMIATINQDTDMWLGIANVYAENNQNSKAKAALMEALKIDKNYVNGIVRLAILLYKEGSYDAAIPYLERAVEESQSEDVKQEVSKLLATSYKKTNRIDQAIAKYESLLESKPGDVEIYLKLAELYRAATLDATDSKLIGENNQKAIETLNRLKAVAPDDTRTYLMLADVYLATERNNEAEANANAALGKNGNMYEPYMILAAVNQRNGIAKFNSYVDKDKEFQKAYGPTANRLDKERKALKAAANGYFVKSQDNLRSAKSRTSKEEVIADINAKLATITQLIGQTLN